MCKRLILCRGILLVRECRYTASWCDIDLTHVLAVVTLTLKILSRLYLGNRKL